MQTQEQGDSDVVEELEKYDFVRFTAANFLGVSQCRVIPKWNLMACFKTGPAVFAGGYNQFPLYSNTPASCLLYTRIIFEARLLAILFKA